MSGVLSQGRAGLCRGRERAPTIRLDAPPLLLPQFPHPLHAGQRHGRARCVPGTVPGLGMQEQLSLPQHPGQHPCSLPCRLSGGEAAWRWENFPAERRRPAASPLSPGVGTLRPVGRDRRRGFRSFLQQLVIDFSGRNIFAFRRPCHKPSASAREKQMES